MAQTDEIKRPLVPGEFSWFIKKDGGTGCIIGPDPGDVQGDEVYIKPDPRDYTKFIAADSPMDAVQEFVAIRPDQYAVIHNPAETVQGSENYPNGSWKKGRTDMPSLIRGAKKIVTTGSFPIWPGQKVDLRDVHSLSTSQYLVAIVESPVVDTEAPYYELTKKCAAIRVAVVDDVVTTERRADGEAEAAETEAAPAAEARTDTPDEEQEFVRGQRIVIPGKMTPLYIPPTGIEVVQVSEEQTGATEKKPESVDEIVDDAIQRGVLKIENLQGWLEEAGMTASMAMSVEDDYTSMRQRGNYDESLTAGLRNNLGAQGLKRLAETLRKATVQPEPTDKAVRQAVVLGPTQFCVLLDEDGNPQTKVGPGRVFPGPYDHFRTEGSDNRVYQAYHLRPDRGMLLRIVADISREDLLKQLPAGVELDETKKTFVKGDEIFIGGFDAYFVPQNAVEVINPRTRQPQIGNKHSQAYVYAIGVDQKSGVYVSNVDTGNIALVKGETKLLLDPRTQTKVNRRVPQKMWNLMIGANEPHKRTGEAFVETPWALSVVVPNNEAVLVIGKDSRKAIVGPTTVLLEYEERFEVLTLSKGKPKTDDNQLETCFLRVTGNRISDVVELVTKDFVSIKVAVSYGVDFVGDSAADREKWFNDKDYVMLLCNNMRSRLRAAARKLTLDELYPVVADFVRDTVLGEKPEDGSKRPGHLFEENNMEITEVEVLSATIPDPVVAERLLEANRQIVTLQIDTLSSEAKLEAAKVKDAIEQEEADLELGSVKRKEKVERAKAVSTHKLAKEKTDREQELQKSQADFDATVKKAGEELADILSKYKRDRKLEEAGIDQKIAAKQNETDQSHLKAISEIEATLLSAAATAAKTQLEAIQPGLVEAISGLGDKQILTELAKAMPQATGELGYILGAGGFAGLTKMLEGTHLGDALAKIGKQIEETRSTVREAAAEVVDE